MDKFHLIGIKGTGMSALANILVDLGYDITGSDVERDFFTVKKIKNRNIKISLFSKDNIVDDRIYIASSCYKDDNVEIEEIKKRKLQFYYYHEFIEQFFKCKKIGISGTHGKTTTTSLVAKLLEDKQTTYLIGDGTGKGVANPEYFIFEACEYKNHLLNYKFHYLVINNIDLDHPDFFNTIDDVVNTFQNAANNAKKVIINADDIYCQKIKHKNILTFGMNKADVCGKVLKQQQRGYILQVDIKGQKYEYLLPFPGVHMIYNFLAALAISYENGINLEDIQQKILSYKKPSRRMEEYFYYNNIIIDDYAHHPLEIKMCLEAVKQSYPNKKIIVIFQPHTYSRTIKLKESFRDVFKGEKLYLAKTFTSKREENNIELDEEVFKIFENAKPFSLESIKEIKQLNDSVILFIGAGDIDNYIKKIL